MLEKDLAINVENISKRYRLGLKEQSHEEFITSAFEFIRKPINNFKKYRSLYKFDEISEDHNKFLDTEDVLWALKGISFQVKKGEVLGIIGTNGAGKSTLLKILSRITVPTTGRIQIRGRVSSLLEVGTGFHNELTGRENVYLNGTILGMKKKEIDKAFDQIVDFSGVEKFLDTPVKRYSSGMRVRLAFAVAAHLEPEVLIIDEVLAVGDAEFQKKCIGKMQDVGKQGKTVLFVSHSMPAITRMCDRVILLNAGEKSLDGPTSEVIKQYLKGDKNSTAIQEWKPEVAPSGEVARINSICVRDGNGNINEAIDIRNDIQMEISFEVLKSGHVLLPSFTLWSEDGTCALESVDLDPEWRNRERPVGQYISKAIIPGNLFGEGMFTVNTAMYSIRPSILQQYAIQDAIAFQLVDSTDGDTSRGDWPYDLTGIVRPSLKWITEVSANSSTNNVKKFGT